VKPGWATQRFAVAAANPLATAAGAQMLRAGGSAVDAAIAVQMVLTLVEPQSSGIGGGAFLMHWDGQRVQALDGRETAPAGVDERLFLQADGRPMDFMAAAASGRSVGVPGVLRMLALAHAQHGVLPWASLFQPAIDLAEGGFEVSPRLNTLLRGETALQQDRQAHAYFWGPGGQPWPVGHRLRNPALAHVLRQVAAGGAAAFYEGPVARDVVQRVQSQALPGALTAADLASYRALQREPLCTDWREIYRVCGFPPPSSGHLAIMQMLGMLAQLPASATPELDSAGRPSAGWLHRYSEVAKLAFADRALYVADPAFVAPPAGDWRSLLDDDYLQLRAASVGERSLGPARAGAPRAVRAAFAPQAEQTEHGTSHISIVDAQGHALAMTTTIESAFGARIMSDGGTGLAGGFLLNNQLTDFSFLPQGADGQPVANRVQPGKRPRSSMSPTLVFDRRDGRLLMSLGSPGGAAIIHFTTKALLGMGAWGLNAQQAVNLPNVVNFNGPIGLEAGAFDAETVTALQARGHVVNLIELTSGLQALQRTPSGWFGGADPRREGVVMGD
jgi:gamma-glutamyltranspeptidase/glutathione hydrolase